MSRQITDSMSFQSLDGADVPVPVPVPGWALFLDFDGTLVEIADSPHAVHVPEALPALLHRIESRLSGALAIVTGRPISEIDRYLLGGRGCVAGLHGLERRGPDGTIHRAGNGNALLGEARRRLRDFVPAHPGVFVEDKGEAVALHFRAAPEHEQACDRFVHAVADDSAGHLAVQAGKMVRELKPSGVDKGAAVLAYLEAPPFRGRRPVFVGDDITDEYGFAAVNQCEGISIVVGDREPTAARHRFAEVPALLAWLQAFEGLPHR